MCCVNRLPEPARRTGRNWLRTMWCERHGVRAAVYAVVHAVRAPTARRARMQGRVLHASNGEGELGKIHIYLLGAPDPLMPEKELILFDKAGYTVAVSRLAIDDQPAYTPARERPKLQSMLRRLAPRDTLVVLELPALGCNARDILATLMHCRKSKIVVKCVEVGHTDLAGLPEPAAVKTLRALVRL